LQFQSYTDGVSERGGAKLQKRRKKTKRAHKEDSSIAQDDGSGSSSQPNSSGGVAHSEGIRVAKHERIFCIIFLVYQHYAYLAMSPTKLLLTSVHALQSPATHSLLINPKKVHKMQRLARQSLLPKTTAKLMTG